MRARGCLCGQIYGFAVLITTAMVIPVMVVFGLQSDTQHADAATTQQDSTSTETARTETAPAQAPRPGSDIGAVHLRLGARPGVKRS